LEKSGSSERGISVYHICGFASSLSLAVKAKNLQPLVMS